MTGWTGLTGRVLGAALALAMTITTEARAQRVIVVADPGLPGFHDEYEEHFARGKELYALQKYEDALIEYRAAYEIRQNPDVLYVLGWTARKLGRTKLAIDYFERFLGTQSDIYSPRSRADTSDSGNSTAPSSMSGTWTTATPSERTSQHGDARSPSTCSSDDEREDSDV